MENLGNNYEKTTLSSALFEGRKHANELKRQLHPSLISGEDCGPLVDKILSSYDNALSLLNYMGLLGNGNPSQGMLESPSTISIEGSPRSEGSDPDSKDQVRRNVFKKRKTSPKWSEQVRVCSGTGVDGQIGDGYNWRKYGQKDILGANHPRAYYRCTHRNTQGCLATKQVQRTDEDPSIFEVFYRGKHTCVQERLKQNKDNPNTENKEKGTKTHTEQKVLVPQTYVLKNENQEFDVKMEKFPSFSFRSIPAESKDVVAGFFSEYGNLAGTSYSPPFLSPATSDSYFSLSPCQVNDFGIDQNLQGSESDLAEIISNPTSIPDFMFGELDFAVDQVGFDSGFLDALEYFK